MTVYIYMYMYRERKKDRGHGSAFFELFHGCVIPDDEDRDPWHDSFLSKEEKIKEFPFVGTFPKLGSNFLTTSCVIVAFCDNAAFLYF